MFPAAETRVVLRKLTNLQLCFAQSVACGFAGTLLAALAGAVGILPPVVQSSFSVNTVSLLAPAVGMAWVFTSLDSRFWRTVVFTGFLLQLPLAAYLAFRFKVSLSVWPIALSWFVAAGIPEIIRHRNTKAAELELDPTFFKPSAFRPNPVAVAESVRVAEELPPQRVPGTVLFCELVNHATLADSLPPEVWATYLNRLLFLYQETATAHGGRAERNDGDGFRAVFCTPFGVEEHPEAALHTALALRGRVATLSQECAVKFGHELDVRMGVSTGDLLIASFGPPEQQRPGVAGETADWARRLAGANLRYGTRILISARTGLLGGHSIERRPIDLLQRHPSPHLPEDVFEVICLQHTLDSAAQTRLRFYREGVQLFRARKWSAARLALMAARPVDQSDEAVDALLMRIQEQESLASYARQ